MVGALCSLVCVIHRVIQPDCGRGTQHATRATAAGSDPVPVERERRDIGTGNRDRLPCVSAAPPIRTRRPTLGDPHTQRGQIGAGFVPLLFAR